MNTFEPEHTKLNLGSGHKKLLDFWNVDIDRSCNPDQIIDLETCPWDLPSDYFEYINAENILEHLGPTPKSFINILQEMYRVSKDQATWSILFPHHRSDLYFDDITHVRQLTARSFLLFDQKHNFEIIAKKRSDSVLGLTNGIDLENKEVHLNVTGLFQEKVNSGDISNKQMELKLNTACNVCESVKVTLVVHKPGRYENWYRTVKK